MKVGFIGLGNLGMAISKRLLNAGFDLTVHNRSRGKVEEMVALGAASATSVAEITRGNDIVITCLPDVVTVEELYLGHDGIIDNARQEQILIDQSTVTPSTSRKLAEAAEARGAKCLDAPVSGVPAMAEAGNLTVLVGGDKEAFEKAMPIFQAQGQTILYCGPPGMGTTVKLAVNALVATNAAGAAEAFNFGVTLGVEPGILLEALKSSSARSFALENMAGALLNRRFDGATNLHLFLKDLALLRIAAKDNGVALPSADVAHQLCLDAAKNWPEATHISSMFLVLEDSVQQVD